MALFVFPAHAFDFADSLPEPCPEKLLPTTFSDAVAAAEGTPQMRRRAAKLAKQGFFSGKLPPPAPVSADALLLPLMEGLASSFLPTLIHMQLMERIIEVFAFHISPEFAAAFRIQALHRTVVVPELPIGREPEGILYENFQSSPAGPFVSFPSYGDFSAIFTMHGERAAAAGHTSNSELMAMEFDLFRLLIDRTLHVQNLLRQKDPREFLEKELSRVGMLMGREQVGPDSVYWVSSEGDLARRKSNKAWGYKLVSNPLISLGEGETFVPLLSEKVPAIAEQSLFSIELIHAQRPTVAKHVGYFVRIPRAVKKALLADLKTVGLAFGIQPLR